MHVPLDPDAVANAMFAPLDRRELAELVTWLDHIAARASAAVAASIRRPGGNSGGVAVMAAELHDLAAGAAAWQARTT